MSLIKKELTEKSGFVIEFSVSEEVYKKAELAAYKKNVKSINVPGFRKGKAPKAIIEQYYGKGVFFEDAINECIPDAFEEAVKEAGLDIVGQPTFDIVSTDGDIVLKAEGFVKPEVTIEGYKGIEIEKKVEKVTAKDVDAEVENARKRNARTVEVTDRAAAMGDIANIDYEGSVDGVAFDGGKGEGHDLTLGSGAFIPGFEDQIVGKTVGEEFDVNVTFPEEYHAKELAGKAAVFKTKLNALKVEELPALDDEFVKDVSEFDTLAEYKADIKAKMTKRNEEKADAELENALAEALMEKLVAEIPEPMFAQETENYVRDYDSRLRQNGLDLKTYFKYTGLTLEALREQLRPQAEKQVKVRLALEKIAALENLTATDEEVEAEYTRISEAYNVPADDVKKMIAAEDIKADLVVAAAMKLVKDNVKAPAKKTTKKAEKAADAPAEEKPAAKKPAAKKTTKKADADK
ncbi:MAG: trigger factor [Clostridia bacterium]|nr:trigger factor [Clostridia bacterium]